MFYIATNNHYLFVGLDSLLKPYKSKKIRTIKRNNPKHLNFSAGDTIFLVVNEPEIGKIRELLM